MTNTEVDQYFTDRWKKKAKKILQKREKMGLDMFMYKRDKDGKVLEGMMDVEVDGFETEFIYWRKANSIHKWMVDNIQNGVDDCEEYPLTNEQLTFFYDELVQARLKRDTTIFPVGEGFFFGNTTYDEYYWANLRDTIEKLKPEIEAIREDPNEYTYFYQSSW